MMLAPAELVRDGAVDRLNLVAKGEGAALKAGDRATARVRLKDGRSFDLAATVKEARPRPTLLGRSVSQGEGAGRILQLSGEDLLPDDGRMVFSVRAEQGAAFRADRSAERRVGKECVS